jgi:hypothetical protein
MRTLIIGGIFLAQLLFLAVAQANSCARILAGGSVSELSIYGTNSTYGVIASLNYRPSLEDFIKEKSFEETHQFYSRQNRMQNTPITRSIFTELEKLPQYKNALVKYRAMGGVAPSFEVFFGSINQGDVFLSLSPEWHSDLPLSYKDHSLEILAHDSSDIFLVHFSSPNQSLSRTQYLTEDLTSLESSDQRELERIFYGEKNSIYKDVNEFMLAHPDLKTAFLEDGQVLHMNSKTLHRRTVSTGNGQRYFLRVVFNYELLKMMGSNSINKP